MSITGNRAGFRTGLIILKAELYGTSQALMLYFEKETDTPEAYALTVQNGSGGGSFEAGEQVTITANPAPSGQVFSGWTGGNGGAFANASSAVTTFTMPANSATVTATYRAASGTTNPVGNVSGSYDRSSSEGGSGGGFANTILAAMREQQASVNSFSGLLQGGQNYIRTNYSGRYMVTAAAWAVLGGMQYQHDSTGNHIQVRLYIDQPPKMRGDIYVSGWTSGADVNATRSLFERFFGNKVQVVRFDHTGEWGQTVRVAAMVDLSGMDAENLALYNYDGATNVYREITEPNYYIDRNGYLHFRTDFGGAVIVSNGALTRK